MPFLFCVLRVCQLLKSPVEPGQTLTGEDPIPNWDGKNLLVVEAFPYVEFALLTAPARRVRFDAPLPETLVERLTPRRRSLAPTNYSRR
jgi:hypothetical protein